MRFLVALSLSTSLALGQSTPIPRLGESIEVSIVNVDVFVTDRDGRRVHGLKKADFEIFEDGKRQPITNFAEYADVDEQPGHLEAAVATPPESAPRQKRTIVVFVDRFSLPPFHSEPMFNALRSFLRAVVRPGDAVTIISWRQQVIVRLPFTDKLEDIERVLTAIEKESSFVSADDRTAFVAEIEFEHEMAGFASQHNVVLEPFDRPTVGAREAAMRAKFDMRRKFAAISGLIGAISAAEGTKAVILATHRFSRIAGREFLNPEPGGFSWSERDNDMSKEIESLIRTANANNVRIYPLYPEGLGSTALGSAELKEAPSPVFDYLVLENEILAMKEVSDETGGTMAWGAKNIVGALPAIREDFGSYYSLAYRATSSGKDRAHSIAVKVKDRGYSVRSRSAYVEKSDATRMKERVVANLFGNDAGGTIPVNVSFGTAQPSAKGTRTVPVTVSFPSGTLVTVPEKSARAGAFSIYVGSGNTLGQSGDVSRETRPFRIPLDQAEKAGSVTFTYTFPMLFDDKTNVVCIGILDEVGKEYGLKRVELPRR